VRAHKVWGREPNPPGPDAYLLALLGG